MEVYCKKVCPWCDDGFPVIELDGVYYHEDVSRTAPEADPRELCNATPIRAAVAAAVAEEREACAVLVETRADEALMREWQLEETAALRIVAKQIRSRASGGNGGAGKKAND